MNIYLKTLALFIIGLVDSDLCFASDSYSCPATVRLASGSLVQEDIPAGYESLVSSSIIRLSGNNLYDGPPKEGAALKPTSSKGNVATWILPGKYPQGVWISCDYADGLVKIIARTSDSVTSCIATSEKVKPHNTLAVRFVCK